MPLLQRNSAHCIYLMKYSFKKMKSITTLLAISACILFLSACKDNSESNIQYEEQMKDSIFKYYPSVASITVGVKENTELSITLGSVDMFSKTDDAGRKTANELGMMALRLFPKDNSLEKGQLIVSKDEKSDHVNVAEAKVYNINIDSLRKVMGK